MENTVLLLTSCVNPSNMTLLTVKDEAVRKEQYLKAINFYLEKTISKIVITDNSAFDFRPFIPKQFSDRVECLYFKGNQFDPILGKGYGEIEILDYTFQHSSFVKENTLIVKITGRIIISNVNQLVKAAHLKNQKTKALHADFGFSQASMKSMFFIAPVSFFVDYFLPKKNLVNDSLFSYFERVLFQASMEWKTKHKVCQFLTPILYEGVSGTTGRTLTVNQTTALKLKHFTKSIYLNFKLNKK